MPGHARKDNNKQAFKDCPCHVPKPTLLRLLARERLLNCATAVAQDALQDDVKKAPAEDHKSDAHHYVRPW